MSVIRTRTVLILLVLTVMLIALAPLIGTALFFLFFAHLVEESQHGP